MFTHCLWPALSFLFQLGNIYLPCGMHTGISYPQQLQIQTPTASPERIYH